jgi:hypothetical protein
MYACSQGSVRTVEFGGGRSGDPHDPFPAQAPITFRATGVRCDKDRLTVRLLRTSGESESLESESALPWSNDYKTAEGSIVADGPGFYLLRLQCGADTVAKGLVTFSYCRPGRDFRAWLRAAPPACAEPTEACHVASTVRLGMDLKELFDDATIPWDWDENQLARIVDGARRACGRQ